MAEAQYNDDPSIESDSRLFRRVPPAWIVWDNNLQRWRPTKAAFSDSPDGHPMSVALECELVAHGSPPSSVLVGHDGFGLASITAQLARDLGQAIVRDPQPGDPAHGLVFGNKTDSIRKKMAKAAAWEVSPNLPPPPQL